jgi:SAM-dependent methyltransferase
MLSPIDGQQKYDDPHVAFMRRRLGNGWSARLAFVKAWCPPGARALDVGCGYGEYALPTATIAAHVDALDITRHAVDAVAAFAAELNLGNVTTINEELLPWSKGREGQYDFCMCTNTLQLLDPRTRRSFLEALERLLSDDGYLLVDFYTPRYFLYRAFIAKLSLRDKTYSFLVFFHRMLRRAHLTKARFEREIAECGFTIVSCGKDILYPSSSYHACRSVEGNNFDTIIGPYFEPYVLKRGPRKG